MEIINTKNYTCIDCNKVFTNKQSYCGHRRVHGVNSNGKSFDTDDKDCSHCDREFNSSRAMYGHIVHCINNPNRRDYKEVAKGSIGKIPSPEHRAKISAGMKKAHEEGRAHTISVLDRYNGGTYPERFIERVFKENKITGWSREYRIGKYFADFAFVKKKLIIEVDGQQHYSKDHIEYDINRDKIINSKGWKIIRINWMVMSNNYTDKIEELLFLINKSRLKKRTLI